MYGDRLISRELLRGRKTPGGEKKRRGFTMRCAGEIGV
jgi:hypothetical protein